MASQTAAVLGKAIRSFVHADAEESDRELLRRFTHENEQRAFAALVNRHAAMV